MTSLEIRWPDEARERVRAARGRLELAGRSLRATPQGEVLALVGEALDRLCDAGSTLRADLVAAHAEASGFEPATVAAGLERALERWSGDALRALFAREIPEPDDLVPFAQTSVVLGGSIPMPSMLSLLLPIALRSPVLARTGNRDPVTASFVRRALEATDADLGRCLEVVAFPSEDEDALSDLLDSPCVCATGSDETLAAIARRLSPAQRFVGYGHKLSIAVVGPQAADARRATAIADGLADDVALWDQAGCLSPVAVYAIGRTAADAIADALARALADRAVRWPRGDATTAERATFAAERSEAEMRAAAGMGVRVLGGRGEPYCVVVEGEASPRPAPLQRFVRVHPLVGDESLEVVDVLEAVAALETAVLPFARFLSSAAVDGFDASSRAAVADRLRALGASRICRPGRMQTPPIDWPHDGRPVFLPLARLGRVEPDA